MLAQNLLQECFFNVSPQSVAEAKKQAVAAGSDTRSFQDILGDSVSRTKTEGLRSDRLKSDGAQSGSGASYRRTTVYRELARDDAGAAQTRAAEPVSGADETLKGKEAAVTEKKAPQGEDIVNRLAQALGLDPGDMEALLGFLDIRPEELADLEKAGEAAQKLAVLAGLDELQEKALFSLIRTAAFKASSGLKGRQDEQAAEMENIGSADKSEWIKTGIDNIEIIDRKPSAEFAEMLASIRERLNRLSGSRGKNSGPIVEELSGGREAVPVEMPGEAAGNIANGHDAAAFGTGAAREEQEPAESVKENGIEPWEEDEANAAGIEESADETGQAVQPALSGTGRPAETGTAVKVDAPGYGTDIDRDGIMSQVVEKAKVLLSGDKSEMIMSLKPESLGRLTLKVVTEHGIIMAKFEAENQQVKQVLESSMELLKDSLEKQGLTVQGFSVSVRDDGAGRGFFNGRQDVKRAAGRGAYRTEAAGAPDISRMTALNPYEASDSSIDLTA